MMKRNTNMVCSISSLLTIIVVLGTGANAGDITDLIDANLFDEMLPYRDTPLCPAHGFYTYEAFVTAAKFFPEFGVTGNITMRKRELAAFLAQTSQQTNGSPPEGPYTWGYCYVNETGPITSDYCCSTQYACAPGKQYYGRGPIQLTCNYNYVPCGAAIGEDLYNNPDLAGTDVVISFKTAIWFWMTPQYNKPSCHVVITGKWLPTADDEAANRLPGLGVTTNIINGGSECGRGYDIHGEHRIRYYKRYCDMLGVSYGENLDCYKQTPFGSMNDGLLAMVTKAT